MYFILNIGDAEGEGGGVEGKRGDIGASMRRGRKSSLINIGYRNISERLVVGLLQNNIQVEGAEAKVYIYTYYIYIK